MGFVNKIKDLGLASLLRVLCILSVFPVQQSVADEVKLAFGVDSISVSANICVGRNMIVEITGLDSGVTYPITFEIYGANNAYKDKNSAKPLDSLHYFIILSETLLNTGIDTLRILTIGGDSVPIENGLLTYEVVAFPTITNQPEGREVCLTDEEVVISVGVNNPSFKYQWLTSTSGEEPWTPIEDYLVYDGAKSNTLKIYDVAKNKLLIDKWWYQVKVSNEICDTYSDSVQIVVDTTAPVFNLCPNNTTIYLVGDECEFAYYDESFHIAILDSAFDECYNPTLSAHRYYNGFIEPFKDKFEIGINIIEYLAEDDNKNYGYCTYIVEVVADDPDLIVPEDVIAFVDPGECGARVTFDDTDDDDIITNCYNLDKLKLKKPGFKSGDFFPVGNTKIYRYIEYIEYFVDTLVTDSFTVTVIDNIPPKITCPENIFINAGRGITTAIVDYELPIITDNCQVVDLIYAADSLLPGAEFPLGVTTIKWGAIDAVDLDSFCEFTINVLDAEAPKLVFCPYDIIINLDPEACDTFLVLGEAEYEDNNDDFSKFHSLDSKDGVYGLFHIGDSTVAWTAIDEAGNINDACVQSISIVPSIKAVLDTVSLFKNNTLTIDAYANDLYCDEYLNINPLVQLSGPWNGTATLLDGKSTIQYIPDNDFIGLDSISYQLCESGGICSLSWIIIDISAEVIPLAVRPDTLITINGSTATGNVIENDRFSKDCDFTLGIFGPEPANASSFQFDTSNGDVSYTPNEGYFEVDSFQYFVCDIWGGCDTATVYILNLIDTDYDNIPDLDDIDDDNDGIPDEVEGGQDTDMDGTPDYLDIDSDGDGIVDNVEAQPEGNYVAPSLIDNNLNGWDDAYDPAEGGTEIAYSNVDNDSEFDFQDLDTDNDNAPDNVEGNDGNIDGLADVISSGSDSDKDGLDDVYDIVDGFINSGNVTGSNVLLQDTDNDGIRDWRDVDDDGDSKTTLVEDVDNNGNPSDDDSDLDGIPDYLDEIELCEIVVPDGFSPNGDGIGDYFYIRCINLYPNAKLIVFNRWGQKIYEKENYGNIDVWEGTNAFWDGTSNVSLQVASGRLSAATYMYILDFGDGSEIRTGTVYINRKSDSMKF